MVIQTGYIYTNTMIFFFFFFFEACFQVIQDFFVCSLSLAYAIVHVCIISTWTLKPANINASIQEAFPWVLGNIGTTVVIFRVKGNETNFGEQETWKF